MQNYICTFDKSQADLPVFTGEDCGILMHCFFMPLSAGGHLPIYISSTLCE